MKKLLHFAMGEECKSLFDGDIRQVGLYEFDSYDVWISGIGPSAVVKTSELPHWEEYSQVINVGFVGSDVHSMGIGDIYQVRECRALDLVVPDQDEEKKSLNVLDLDVESVMCCSSDRFVTPEHLSYIYKENPYVTGVYDMELSTLYDLCSAKKKLLSSVKVVSDNLSLDKFEDSVVELSDRIAEAISLVLNKEEEK